MATVKTPAKARFQPLFQAIHLFRIAVTGQNNLPLPFQQAR